MKPILYNGTNYRKRKDQKYYVRSKANGIYSRYLHRQMWFDAYGPIPKGYHVHHLNHDSLDNRLENLGLMEHKAHSRLHSRKRVKENPEFYIEFQKKGIKVAPIWHGSQEGNQWHKDHWQESLGKLLTDKKKLCDHCGKEYITRAAQPTRFCSNNCKSAFRRKAGLDDVVKQCKRCGKDFMGNKYQRQIVNCQSCRRVKNKPAASG